MYRLHLRHLVISMKLRPIEDEVILVDAQYLHSLLESHLSLSIPKYNYDKQVIGNILSRRYGIRGVRANDNTHLFKVSTRATFLTKQVPKIIRSKQDPRLFEEIFYE